MIVKGDSSIYARILNLQRLPHLPGGKRVRSRLRPVVRKACVGSVAQVDLLSTRTLKIIF